MARQRHLKASQSRTNESKSIRANKKPTSQQRPRIKRDATNSRLQYQPIDQTQQSFRLLRLYPGREKDPIRCDMFNAVISDWSGKYTAGSYVWGSKSHRKRIFVNGRHFYVTSNLYDFLCACRFHHQVHHLILWIDAICIDQKSVYERNHQVSIMAKIYQGAGCTYSWLGHTKDGSDWLFSALNDAAVRELFQQIEQDRTSPDRHVSVDDWKFIKQTLEGISKLASREYWTRIWIVQEVILSSNVIFLCGVQALSWKDIPFGIVEVLERQPQLLLLDVEGLPQSLDFSTIFSIHRAKEWVVRKRNAGLYYVHLIFGHLNCGIPHDSIYALLGMVASSNKQARDFQVDYTLSVPELTIKVLEHFEYPVPLTLLA